jgi:nickel-dependent lactate racemase
MVYSVVLPITASVQAIDIIHWCLLFIATNNHGRMRVWGPVSQDIERAELARTKDCGALASGVKAYGVRKAPETVG